MRTQTDEVIEHLTNFGGITSMQAFATYGITRLSGRIYDLRQRGYNISSQDRVVTNRHGKKVHVTEYVLADREEVGK